jgi:hypothetical protein
MIAKRYRIDTKIGKEEWGQRLRQQHSHRHKTSTHL